MIKCIALLCKRKDITTEKFKDYYENNHAPFMNSLFEFSGYRRNYVGGDDAYIFDIPLDFDVVTELFFEDRAAYDRFAAKSADPDIAQQVAADEENLFAREATRMFVVEVKEGV